ncbi:hypothetical protein C8R43DRAFT_940799 [Mycena crocata]|nr:hypothetical protein C8R43DRAFT_940799 [Mycena crocata]
MRISEGLMKIAALNAIQVEDAVTQGTTSTNDEQIQKENNGSKNAHNNTKTAHKVKTTRAEEDTCRKQAANFERVQTAKSIQSANERFPTRFLDVITQFCHTVAAKGGVKDELVITSKREASINIIPLNPLPSADTTRYSPSSRSDGESDHNHSDLPQSPSESDSDSICPDTAASEYIPSSTGSHQSSPELLTIGGDYNSRYTRPTPASSSEEVGHRSKKVDFRRNNRTVLIMSTDDEEYDKLKIDNRDLESINGIAAAIHVENADLVHNKRDVKDVFMGNESRPSSRAFPCLHPECKKIFTRKDVLRRHSNSAHAENPTHTPNQSKKTPIALRMFPSRAHVSGITTRPFFFKPLRLKLYSTRNGALPVTYLSTIPCRSDNFPDCYIRANKYELNAQDEHITQDIDVDAQFIEKADFKPAMQCRKRIFHKAKCSICKKVVHSEAAVRRHWNSVHSNNPFIWYCGICAGIFTRKSSRDRHERIYAGRTHPPLRAECPVNACGVVFSSGLRIGLHLARDHPHDSGPLQAVVRRRSKL